MHTNMDLYSELGVTPQAEPEVIRAAYRALALRFHPDRRSGSSVLAEAKMARINHAYEVLRHPERRRAYDEACRVQQPSRAAPLLHMTTCRTLAYGVQPFLTTYDQRGRLHAFV